MRNLLRPVNKLPPEILSHVARYILYEGRKKTLSIVPLTHVCRYWRESIVSTPENWTLIHCWHRKMAAVSLERAKAAPLEICVRMSMAMNYPTFHDILIRHFRNTKILAVEDISTFEGFTKMFPNFPQSMPNLRSLTLKLDNIEGWHPSVDPFEAVAHTLEDLKLFDIPLTPSLLTLGSLTELALHDRRFNLPLDTLLNFLEENHSLTSADLSIEFIAHPLRSSRRRSPMRNRLRYLRIWCENVEDAQALISNIPLQRGANLKLQSYRKVLNDILSGISTTHLSNLLSPTFMSYLSCGSTLCLRGPNGVFSFYSAYIFERFTDFVELPLLPLTNVREFRLTLYGPAATDPLDPIVFHPSSFPALEALTILCNTIEGDTNSFRTLSPLLSNPSSSPSLKTLAFLNCNLSEGFMEELTRFASDRKNTTSAWLHRVLIVRRDGKFPSTDSVERLRRHVMIVDVWMDRKLPEDLI